MTTLHKIPEYLYEDCTVLRWVDGDTLMMEARVSFDMGFGVIISGQYTGRFRLYGMDAYERRDPLGPAATEFSRTLMPVGSPVCARTYKDPDNFGRYLALVWVPGHEDQPINAQLVDQHLAVYRTWS